MERWWCIDCRAPVELNRHGRCGCCDSEAVDTMERNYMQANAMQLDAVPVGLAQSSESFQPVTVQLAPVVLFGTKAPGRAAKRLLEVMASHKSKIGNAFLEADDGDFGVEEREYAEFPATQRRIRRVS